MPKARKQERIVTQQIACGRGQTMRLESLEATRRNVILAASAQLVAPVVFAASGAAAVAQNRDVPKSLDVGTIELAPRSPQVFVQYFFRLWETRIKLALAEVEETAQEELHDLASAAMKYLESEKEYTEEIAARVAEGTARVQNIILSRCTDIKDGVVRVTTERIKEVRQYYCSKYPYCR